jgi:uncharacterized short protein YbdD (DUF466 family)
MLDEWRDVTLTPRTARGRGRSLEWLEQLLRTLRKVAGMPDYVEHVQHLHRCHPERPVPTQRQFYDEFVKARYEDGPTRCC